MTFVHNIRCSLVSKALQPLQPVFGSEFMEDFLRTTPAQVVLWTTALLIAIAIGAFVVGRFRDRTGEDRLSANEMLSEFREMRHRGDIDESEYRQIKTELGDRIQQELKDTDETG